MQPLGFSTGALAMGNFAEGVRLSNGHDSVELSALRDSELPKLVEAVPSLELDGFSYVSVHAPSSLKKLSEREVFELLSKLPEAWPIVAHPDILLTPALWNAMGPRLCIENMDNRKSTGRNERELSALFETFPNASFCLDVGHARQIDPTMTVALIMLMEHGHRLRQVHVSDVDHRGQHLPLGTLSKWAYASIAKRIPDDVPLILEAVFDPLSKTAMDREVEAVRECFRVDMAERPARRSAPAEAIAAGE